MNCVPLNVALQICSSGVEKFEGHKYYVNTSNVDENTIVGDIEKITYEKRKSRANMEVQIGDVLFAKMANSRKVLLINADNVSNIYSTGFFVLHPHTDKLRSKYLYYWLIFEGTELLKDRLARGETQRQLNNSQLRNKFKIPLLSLIEQDKWIMKFEKIESALNQLKQQKDTSEKILISERENCFVNMPTHYNLEQIVKEPVYRYPTFYGFKYVEKGVPVLKISNMTKTGKLPAESHLYDHITEKINEKYPKTIVERGDLIMEVRGTYIGKTALVPSSLSGSNISPNTVRISLNRKKILPSYFWHYTFTSGFKNQIKKITRYWKYKFGTVRADRLKKIMIPTPSLEVQRKDLNRLELIDSVVTQFSIDVQNCKNLLQSNLCRAFLIVEMKDTKLHVK